MNKKEIIVTFIVSLCIFGIVHISRNKNSNHFSLSSKDVAIKEVVEIPLANDEIDPKVIIENLRKENNNLDIVSELRIPNSDFKTPIPQSTDNLYYYRRLPNKKHSIIGSTFLDYRTKIDSSKVLIIYGHNSKQYDMPFKVLEYYYDKDYYNNHKYFELVTSDGVKKYEVFSVYVETSDFSYYRNVKFNNNDEFYEHIKSLKNKSFYEMNVELNRDDNILILQACSTLSKYQKYAKHFVLVISREVKNEKSN